MLTMIITYCLAAVAFFGALIFIIIIPAFGAVAIAGFSLGKNRVALAVSIVAVVAVAFLGFLLMDTAEDLTKNARNGRYLTLGYASDSGATDPLIDNKE